MMRNRTFSQYFTPSWAVEALLARYFPNLTPGKDVVCDAGAGDGRWLMAIPEGVEAFGVEIDETLIATAERNSGRQVIAGDFCTVRLPATPTVIVGNPPYERAILDGFLERAWHELDYGGRVGWLVPVYYLQTASTGIELRERWSLEPHLIPRNIFKNFEKPLMFLQMTKDRKTVMLNMFLYDETHAVTQLAARYKTLFIGNETPASLWGEVIESALVRLGGKAHLQDIYREVEGKRPTTNGFWKEQIRKVARKYFKALGDGWYALEEMPKGQVALAF